MMMSTARRLIVLNVRVPYFEMFDYIVLIVRRAIDMSIMLGSTLPHTSVALEAAWEKIGGRYGRIGGKNREQTAENRRPRENYFPR